MKVNLPPILFYAIGSLLVLFGVLRIKFLGAPRPPRRRDEDLSDEVSTGAPSQEGEELLVRGPQQRRHIRWGIMWILMGLFLLVSTFLQARRQLQ